MKLRVPRRKSRGGDAKKTFVYNYFNFERIFEENTLQEDIFHFAGKEVVLNALAGFNGSIIAYGQTGSGKTYTVTGGDSYRERGIIPRAIETLFEAVRSLKDTTDFRIHVSYLQIYNDAAYDLLNPSNAGKPIERWTRVKPRMASESDRLSFRDLSVHRVESQTEALELLFRGNANRITSETPMNMVSSRSHCVFTVNVNVHQRKFSDDATEFERRATIRIVDLAGSESVFRRGGTPKTTTEGRRINLSLHHLEQVVLALRKKKHVPYRNCILTSVLRDSIGNNCGTVLLATLNPEQEFVDETLSTCRFASRCAKLRTELRANTSDVLRRGGATASNSPLGRRVYDDSNATMTRLKHENMELRRRVLVLNNALQASLSSPVARSPSSGDAKNNGTTPDDRSSPDTKQKCRRVALEFVDDPSTDEIPDALVDMDRTELLACFRMVKSELLQRTKAVGGEEKAASGGEDGRDTGGVILG